MRKLSNIYGASPVNNQILLFNGHDSHFVDCALPQMQRKNIQPFILKTGDFINDHPNDNGPNSKLKSLYKALKTKLIMKYGTTRFQPHHMNSVLVETWEAITVSYGNIIRYSFAKNHPPSPPQPTQHDKNYTGMCVLRPYIFKRHTSDRRRHTCIY